MNNITEEECIKCGVCCWFDRNVISGKISELIGEDGFCILRSSEGCELHHDQIEGCESFERGGQVCLELRERLAHLIKVF